MTINDEVGKRIVYFRKEKGMTQEQMALACEMSVSHLGYIERGKINAIIETLAKIASALNVRLADLVDVPVEQMSSNVS